MDKNIKMLYTIIDNCKLEKIVFQFSQASVALFQVLTCFTQKQTSCNPLQLFDCTTECSQSKRNYLTKILRWIEILQNQILIRWDRKQESRLNLSYHLRLLIVVRFQEKLYMPTIIFSLVISVQLLGKVPKDMCAAATMTSSLTIRLSISTSTSFFSIIVYHVLCHFYMLSLILVQ